MALSEIKRQRIRHTKEVLESFKEDNTSINVDNHINEASVERFKDINDVEDYINNRQFRYIQMGSFRTASHNLYSNMDSFSLSIFFMSNKNTKVDENGDNCVSLSFYYDEGDGVIYFSDNYDERRTSLETFMELPVNVEGDTDEKISEVVAKCDCAYIYDLYLEDALNLVSDGMNTAYQLFKNPNLFKMMDRSINSLGVTYSPKLKKFIYLYNPDFIMSAAVEEWMKCKNSYESLRSCYVYLLAYFITHEMMHIIYNNTSTDNSGAGITDINLSDNENMNHTISNIVQDSFINSELAIRFKRPSGTYGIRQSNNLAPIPKIGVDSRMCFRGEHNKGFKEFKTEEDLMNLVVDLYRKTAKLGDSRVYKCRCDNTYDLKKFKGADIYVQVEVNPRSRDIRQSSIVFQKFINDLIRTITDGNIYDRFSVFTQDEKATDKDILPNGSLVRIKNIVDICVVVGYDEETGMYTLNTTDSTLIKNPVGDGTFECHYDYEDSGVLWGDSKRSGFIPFDKDSYDNVWIEGEQKEEKRKLEPEDLMPQQPPMPGMTPPTDTQQEQEKPKSFNIGDIVYIKTAGVFGRITNINDGRFELEEMKEENARVLDDSRFH